MIPLELGTQKVSKLLKQYALPAIIAMTASSLYNMVDSIYIGQGVGPMAISGLAITFPLMNLSAAFGTLVGVGASTLMSVLLGQKNYDTAKKVLGNVVLLNIIIGLIFMTLALVFLDPILYFFGASEFTINYARDYMFVILLGNVVTHMYFGLNSLLRAAGHPKKAMTATILTVIINTILDPIFIFVLDMGIQGAAIATVLAQIISLAWLIKIFSNKKELLHFSKGIFKIDYKIAGQSLSIGLAPFLMNVASCFVVIFINNRLKQYGGDLAIGAYGIINRIVFIFLMIVMGFTQGMQPIAGYNYGAKQYHRVIEVLKLTIKCAVCVMTFSFIVAMLIPGAAVSIFTSDTELISIASKGLRLVSIFAPFVGFQMVVSNFFQSLGLVRKAVFLSLSRQLLFLIPCLALLPHFFGIKGVWLSLPIADLISAIVAVILLSGLLKKFKKEMNENEQIHDSEDVFVDRITDINSARK